MKKAYTRLLPILLALLTGAGASLRAQEMDRNKITGPLFQEMEASPGVYHKAYVLLADRARPREMEADFRLRKAPMEERVYELITSLQAKAEATQPAMLSKMQSLPGIRPESFNPLWITNIIYFEGTREAVAALSLDPAVEEVGLNGKVEFERAVGEVCAGPAQNNSAELGLKAIGAPQMWAMGYTGYGRRALIVDTGQDPSHPALHNQFLYHNRDITETWRGDTEPEDCGYHGSHVTGTVLGLDRLAGDTIGVAFDAKWLGGLAWSGGCSAGADVAGTNGMFQWALNPDGNPSTINDIPDVINNSWRSPDGSCTSISDMEVFNALYAAGIAVVFSAGNDGPGISTITPPKYMNWDTVRLFSVAAVNGNNSNLSIASFSSRGPSICGGDGSLLIKPEVAAPGVNVRSSIPGGYDVLDGTSMAAPHVAGAILLLKQAFPYLTGEEIKLALYYSCTDLGIPGEDNDYGMGLINVPAAFDYLVGQGHVPEPPQEAPNDVLLLQIDNRELNCESQILARLLVENAGTEAVTSLDIRHSLRGEGAPVIFTYHWEGHIEPGERAYIQMPVLPSDLGDFEYAAEIFKANGAEDARRLNNQLKKDIRIVADESFEGQVSGNRQVCQGGGALLQSLFDGPGRVRWYDELEGGNLLAEGRNAVLLAVEEPRTVYMEVSPAQKVGRVNNEGNTQQFINQQQGLVFDAYTDFTIRSVKVYAEEAGNRLLILSSPDGSTITKVVPVQAGEQRVNLGLDVWPGEGWELRLRAGKPLGINQGGSPYPFVIPNVVSINRSTQGLALYHYFYDWEVEFPYYCGRVPVEVDVQETANAPQAAFSPIDGEIDLATGINEVAFTDQTQGGTFWLWNFGDGTTSTMRNPTHAYADTGQYRVILTVIGQSGCASSVTGTVTVTESAVSSTGSLAQDYGMEVFPNPARDMLYLKLDIPAPRPAEVLLADMLGRPVWRRRLELLPKEAAEINVAGLPAGLYSVIVRMDGEQVGRRVVVSR